MDASSSLIYLLIWFLILYAIYDLFTFVTFLSSSYATSTEAFVFESSIPVTYISFNPLYSSPISTSAPSESVSKLSTSCPSIQT